ncbi:hypothetical protein ACL7C8_15190 [Bordetella pertussis]
MIRFRNPIDGATSWNDMVKGPISFDNGELDDLIIARRTARPPTISAWWSTTGTWASPMCCAATTTSTTTPRQINILRALGATLPNTAMSR